MSGCTCHTQQQQQAHRTRSRKGATRACHRGHVHVVVVAATSTSHVGVSCDRFSIPVSLSPVMTSLHFASTPTHHHTLPRTSLSPPSAGVASLSFASPATHTSTSFFPATSTSTSTSHLHTLPHPHIDTHLHSTSTTSQHTQVRAWHEHVWACHTRVMRGVISSHRIISYHILSTMECADDVMRCEMMSIISRHGHADMIWYDMV